MNIFLDSSSIIAYLKADTKVKEEIDSADEIYSSSLCVFEVLLGEEYAKIKGFKPKNDASAFFGGMTIIPFSEEDAKKAAEVQAYLISKGIIINGMDVLIAASAYRMNLTIIAKDHDYDSISSILNVKVKVL